MLKRGKYFREVSWPEALDEVASRLKGLEPEDFLMVVSPDLTNESLYAAQKFVRSVPEVEQHRFHGALGPARRARPVGPALLPAHLDQGARPRRFDHRRRPRFAGSPSPWPESRSGGP